MKVNMSAQNKFDYVFYELQKSSVQTIGEEQVQNPYTELLVLKGHQDIVRFLVQIDDYRYEIAF